MILHIYKLIWNKKKQNFLLMLELFVSFIVLFVVFFNLLGFYNLYNTPRGFEYRNVWSVNYGLPAEIKSRDSIAAQIKILKNIILSMPQVAGVSFSSVNVPYSSNEISNSVGYKGKEVMSSMYMTDQEYAKVLQLKMLAGNWSPSKRRGSTAVVINKMLKEKLFGAENAIGKRFNSGGSEDLVVTGIVDNTKLTGDYRSLENVLFKVLDTVGRDEGIILIRVRPDADAAFESHLYKIVSNFSKNTNVEIEHLEKKRIVRNNFILVPFIIVFSVAAFLIINVALGIFGVLWYNISRRRSEIGLRRAAGASGKAISMQITGEALILSTISLLAGLFFAIQFPLLGVGDVSAKVYLLAIGFSVIFIYLLVIVCSVYPAKQAASVYPADALRED